MSTGSRRKLPIVRRYPATKHYQSRTPGIEKSTTMRETFLREAAEKLCRRRNLVSTHTATILLRRRVLLYSRTAMVSRGGFRD